MFLKRKEKSVAPFDGTRVKILGSGCAKCRELESNTREALRRLGQPEQVEHVTDFAKIAAYGVMQTPAVVLDDCVLVSGQVPKVEQIVQLLENAGI